MSSERVTTRLLLVRHGESKVTVARTIGGPRTCSGLSPLGVRQAAALRKRFEAGHEPHVDVLCSSTLPRAYETAEVLAPGLGDLPIAADADLSEMHPGESDGLTFDAFVAKYGSPAGPAEPHRPMCPGAESPAEFHHRVDRVLHRLLAEHCGATVLVACHGGVIDVAMRSLLGLGMRTHFDLWTLNTSITEFAATGPARSHHQRMRLVRYNDAAHLAGLPAETPTKR
ncbi:MAG: histidine phosphatase family protein [Acidimicrobiales bacterium]